MWSVSTTAFSGSGRTVAKLHGVRVEWNRPNGSWQMKAIEGSDFELETSLVLLAMGFVSPVQDGLLQSLEIALDNRGNVLADTIDYQTSVPSVFAAGDMRRGQSLVVWAIREGRQCARAVDEFLMGRSDLPR